MSASLRPGFVYALFSETSPHIKIGRTETSPHQRLSELNNSDPYRCLGPWHLLTCMRVADVIEIERTLHLRLGSRRHLGAGAARELFVVSRSEALEEFGAIPVSALTEPVPILQLKVDPAFLRHLLMIFELTALDAFLDQQEAWTFALFPKTAGGRWFTINIGTHEVAFASLPQPEMNPETTHAVVVDALIARDSTVKAWLAKNGGWIEHAPYVSALDHSMIVRFFGDFDGVRPLFQIPGMRRAVIAYWYDALLAMRATGKRSMFARFHNYAAVAEIMRYRRESSRFTEGHR